MSLSEDRLYMSVEEYLTFEETAKVRHEYIDGQIFAMTGATLRHNIIANNLHSILSNYLKGSGCRAFTFDVKLLVETANSFYYPDILVSCSSLSAEQSFLTRPVLIVEVLSPSTAAIDRREKLIAYKQIESLREYLIISQSRKQIEIFERNARGRFAGSKRICDGMFLLNSMPNGPLNIDIQSLYEDVVWETPAAPEDDTGWLVREAGELTW